jgi:hypothetical protein
MNLNEIKLYHIVHIDRLASIIEKGGLFSDAEVHSLAGTTIGITEIKRRRLEELTLSSHADLHVGECVPFYFCPRSVMLYMFYMDNHPDISYHGGQESIIHLVASMDRVIAWAGENKRRWAFTDSNAGSRYYNDYASVQFLDKLDWGVINATQWSSNQDKKQAEFLLEQFFPWRLFEQIGVYDFQRQSAVENTLRKSIHKPTIAIQRNWYY